MDMAVRQTEHYTCPRTASSSGVTDLRLRSKIPAAPIHDREGLATGAVIVFRDVSAARAMAVQMAHSAQHDFLTGLPNRMLLSDRVNQAIFLAWRHMKKSRCCFLDLDGFKHINDSWDIRSATNFSNPLRNVWWIAYAPRTP